MDRTPTYAFSVKLLAPEFTPSEVAILSDNLLDSDLFQSRETIVSTNDDQLVVTFVEGTHDINDHLREVLFLARVGLRDTGIDKPVITGLFATPTSTVNPVDAHVSVANNIPLLERVDLTDQMLLDEI